MKKITYIILIAFLLFCTGCLKQEEHISGNLNDIMKNLYEGIPEEEFPKLVNNEVNKENEEYFLGTKDVDYQEAIASEPLMSSIAHSVVLIRMKDVKEVEQAKKKIKEKINPRKWICVEVEEKNVLIESRGDLIVVIMDNQYASTIKENFFKLNSENK